jgi:2-furoyl-CoA dehydrogenase FAD binding subunit
MHVAEWNRIENAGGMIRIGAAVRQSELERRPDLASRQPLLAAALPWIGHAQTRSRGTICGSVAHADPSAELPLVLITLGGEVETKSQQQKRRIPADGFFTGMMTTDLRHDELIEAVNFPAARVGTGYAFREIARRHGDFAIVACAAMVDAVSARLAIAGVADRPMARELPLPGDPALDDALDAFAWDLDARDDLHATAAYRRQLVRRIGRKTLEDAVRCRA